MLRPKTISLFIVAAIVLLCGHASADGPAPAPVVQPKLESVYLSLEGVRTDEVMKLVYRRLTSVTGVKSLTWTAPRKEVKVVRIVGQATTASLVAAAGRAGATARQLTIKRAQLFFQRQLHCNGCVIKVKRAMKGVKGTKEVNVASDKLSVTVLYDAKKATVKKLRDALTTVGYPAKPER